MQAHVIFKTHIYELLGGLGLKSYTCIKITYVSSSLQFVLGKKVLKIKNFDEGEFVTRNQKEKFVCATRFLFLMFC